MRYPIVELAFWNPGEPGHASIDALIADPTTPLAKHGLSGIAEIYASSTGAPLHHVHADWAAEMAIKSLGVDGALYEVVPALRGAGIPFFIAKGPAIAYFDYPDPRMRPYTDLDVYVPEDLVLEARDVLSVLGYDKVPQVTGPLGGIGSELHGGSYGAVVEVHGHAIDNLHRRYIAPIRSWLPYVESRVVCGVDVPVLTSAAHLALQAIHLGAGHRYQKLVLYRDIATRSAVKDSGVVNQLGAKDYAQVARLVLNQLHGSASIPPSSRHYRIARALRSDPVAWDEYAVSWPNALALLSNSQRSLLSIAAGAPNALLHLRNLRVRPRVAR